MQVLCTQAQPVVLTAIIKFVLNLFAYGFKIALQLHAEKEFPKIPLKKHKLKLKVSSDRVTHKKFAPHDNMCRGDSLNRFLFHRNLKPVV